MANPFLQYKSNQRAVACHAGHDTRLEFNTCRFRFTRLDSMSPSVFLLSQQALIAPPRALRSSIPLAARFAISHEKATRRRQLSIDRFQSAALALTKRKVGVVAMAAWPTGLLPSISLGQAALLYMELALVVYGPVQAWKEVNGENMRYSKFASEGKKKKEEEKEAMIASKTGMFLFYFPAALLATAFLACRLEILPLAPFLESSWGASGAAAFWENALLADAGDHRLLLVAAALSVHFSKRVLEVLFVHNYSGSTSVADTAQIAFSYAMQVGLLLYSQLLSAAGSRSAAEALPGAPNQSLEWLGVALFLIGVTGNAYHHWLLSHLRKDHGSNNEEEKKKKKSQYVVPQGGLFGLLVCPHYLFEMVDMAGIALISQTLFGGCILWFVLWYLTARAVASKKWYLKKVEGFPEERSVLIPGVF